MARSTALLGGSGGYGTVFKLNPDGTGFTVLKNFYIFTTGGYLAAGLIQGTDGALYGTAVQGGSRGYGTVFKLNTDGTGFTVLKNFDYFTDGGYLQGGGLVQRTDGTIYGTAYGGGSSGAGTVFQLNADGSDFSVFLNFDGANGGYPFGKLSQGTDGNLYGTTAQAGYVNGGTVFRLVFTSPNTPPVANAQSITTPEDSAASITLNGSDADGDALTFTVLTTPVHGSLSGVAPNFTYTPVPDYHGPDSFMFTVTDGKAPSATATVNITVTDVLMGLSAIAPTSATADGNGFVLTVNGSTFEPDTVVYWNGIGRPTTYISPTEVTAQIPASDLAGILDIQTVSVTVGEPTGPESAGAVFAIVPASVGDVQTSVVSAGGTATISSPPTSTSEPGVAVSVENSSGDPITVVAATYETRPTGQALFKVDSGSFVDVQFTGADSSDKATVQFYYTASVTGGAENKVKLRYYDGANWITVLSSGGAVPIKSTTDNLDGTVSGGRFTVVLDNTSTPKITELSGTVFGMFDTAPQIGTLSGPTAPLALGASATVSVPFAVLGDWTAARVTFIWDDDSQTIVTPASSSLASAAKTYSAPGVYTVTVLVTDEEESSAEARFEYVVVYDPSAGFVTGGGWINSPAGAYVADRSLTGKANFGFVSKYQKGQSIPTGETEFQFHAAGFKFQSTIYEWLVVSGPLAQYKGSGTINGAGDYGFLLTATDGQVSGGGGVDKFRIKIWEKISGAVVYDNAMGASDDINSANPQVIGGGSIVVHKAR